MKALTPRLVAAVVACGSVALACGSHVPSKRSSSAVGGSSGSAAGGEVAAFGGTGAGGAAGRGGASVAVAGSRMMDYPRAQADAELTKPLVEGPFSLLGGGLSSCTNELPVVGEQWCALQRLRDDGATELWVVNVSAALAAGEPAACDGSSPACLRLTESLWTGTQLWGPSHPYVQRFDGNTLIFHADAAEDVREPYEGPIYGWRPGWESARLLTSSRGVTCNGHRRHAAVFCIDALDVDAEQDGPYGSPYWQSFDLLTGSLDDAPSAALPSVERVSVPRGDAQSFRAQLARQGDKLAYSYEHPDSATPVLRWVSLLGDAAPPATLLEDATGWELAHDGAAVYFLRGFDKVERWGELASADFPSGDNVRVIAPNVTHIDPVGAFDALLSDVDSGIGYDRATAGVASFEFLRDRSKPEEIVEVGADIEAPRVSPDGVHSLFYKNSGQNWPLATVAKNDGSGACTLNNALGSETYGGAFSREGRRVLWIEYGRSGSEEGWIADPSSCDAKTKFGDWVLGFQLVGDFVYFEGGDEADSTSYLQYARIPLDSAPASVTPLVVMEGPGYPFLALDLGEATHLLYVATEDSSAPGLFAHGPLELGAP